MLARLTLGAARLLDVHIEPSNGSGQSLHHSDEEDSALIVDLDAFRVFLPAFPDSSWKGLAAACGRAVAPMYTTVHGILQADIDSVAQLLLDLEDTKFREALPVGMLEQPTPDPEKSCSKAVKIPSEVPKRRRTSSGKTIVISSSNPSIPTIVITLSPSQPRETSCRLPLQDSAFGDLLVVPGHHAYNASHPPSISKPCSYPPIDNWKWESGRWRAVLPPIQEQQKRHLYSRPLAMKRKHRKPILLRTTPAIQSS